MKRKYWLGLSLFLAIVLIGGSGCGKKDTKENAIAAIEAKAGKLKSYRMDINLSMNMMGQEITSSGQMTIKQPQKTRTELTTNAGGITMRQIITSDGKTTWTYQPEMKMATKIDLEKLAASGTELGNNIQNQMIGRNISQPFQAFNKEELIYLGKEEIGGEAVYVFEGIPEIPEMAQATSFAPSSMKIWIAVKDGIVRKMIMLDEKGGEVMTLSFANVEVNPKITDSEFEFTPPAGTQIQDMTEMVLNNTR